MVLKKRKSEVFESFTKTNQKWPRRDGKRIYDICDVTFGDLVFMTIRDSEAFKVFWSLLTSRCVKEMTTLICGLEMSKYSRESSNHSNQANWDLVKINLSGSDVTRWRTISTRLPINNERINQMDWWAFLNMFKTILQRLVIKLMNTGYLRVFALFYFVNWDDVYISLLSIWENDEMSCFGGSFNIEAHLADAVLHSMWVLFSSLEFQLRVTEFSKVRKSSAQRKIAKVLSQWKLKYNITGRNLSDLCDFNDEFLYI